jgi:hypothetical protein
LACEPRQTSHLPDKTTLQNNNISEVLRISAALIGCKEGGENVLVKYGFKLKESQKAALLVI